ncbi:MAG: thiamine biosynthesis protein ThiS [Desulfuromonadales bacterium GWD2_61_12]|nr:MAG: thiamine biosynthesis protein ThiS [Desulfuromonadales bacterium GWC2_61_20]OGR36554.1 MAG: thiamine biosynthesis protein ThiS [Desulfuromonadales bacterium GWD2_61_12]HAD05052.1 thiamine biosynthesis protein ThiS [Desulfuromonas sp.]HBT83952.1 thiamine biosynthesis protein ThiS [Desulfuromonas sp.]
MTIIVNGTAKSDPAADVAGLLTQLGLDPARVAVEYNRNILARERFAATTLADGDELEIVQFVGGG